MIDYEYSDADNQSPRYVPPGQYEVKVKAFEFGMSKTGKDKLSLDLYFDDLDATLREDIYFTPAAAWKFDTVLKCFVPSKNLKLPMKGDKISINNDFVAKFLVGGTGRVDVIEEIYDDNKRSRVKTYLAGAYLTEPGAGSGQADLLGDDGGDDDVPF